jgi:hypothetical protein
MYLYLHYASKLHVNDGNGGDTTFAQTTFAHKDICLEDI